MKKIILSTLILTALLSACSKSSSNSTPTTPTNSGCSGSVNGLTAKINGTAFQSDSGFYQWYNFNGPRIRISIKKAGAEKFAFYLEDTLIGTNTMAFSTAQTRGSVNGYYHEGGLNPFITGDSMTITINSDKTICGTFKCTGQSLSGTNYVITEGEFKNIPVR